MWRRVVRWLAVACLVSAVAVGTLACLSFRAGQTFYLGRCDGSRADYTVRRYLARVARGGIEFSGSRSHVVNAMVNWARRPPPMNAGWSAECVADGVGPGRMPPTYPRLPNSASHPGFGWRYRSGPTSWSVDWVAPAVLPVVVMALPAIAVGLTGGHRRRSRPGACATCGYDRRATPARCPECGAAAAG